MKRMLLRSWPKHVWFWSNPIKKNRSQCANFVASCHCLTGHIWVVSPNHPWTQPPNQNSLFQDSMCPTTHGMLDKWFRKNIAHVYLQTFLIKKRANKFTGRFNAIRKEFNKWRPASINHGAIGTKLFPSDWVAICAVHASPQCEGEAYWYCCSNSVGRCGKQ
jgi:hypothetical protein